MVEVYENFENFNVIVINRISHATNLKRIEETVRENGLQIGDTMAPAPHGPGWVCRVQLCGIAEAVASGERKVDAREAAYGQLFDFLISRYPCVDILHPFSSTRILTFDDKTEEFEAWVKRILTEIPDETLVDNKVITTPLTIEQRKHLHIEAAKVGLQTTSYNTDSGARMTSLSTSLIYGYLVDGGISNRYHLHES